MKFIALKGISVDVLIFHTSKILASLSLSMVSLSFVLDLYLEGYSYHVMVVFL